MQDISKDVAVKIGVQNPDGGKALDDMGKKAKTSAERIADLRKKFGDLRKAAVENASSFTDLEKRLQAIDKAATFQRTVEGLRKASKSIDEFRGKVALLAQEEKRLALFQQMGAPGGKAAGGGGGGEGGGITSGLLRPLRGLGVLAAGHMIGSEVGAWRSNVAANQLGMPIQKGEGGMVANLIGSMRDMWTGRAVRERHQDEMLDRHAGNTTATARQQSTIDVANSTALRLQLRDPAALAHDPYRTNTTGDLGRQQLNVTGEERLALQRRLEESRPQVERNVGAYNKALAGNDLTGQAKALTNLQPLLDRQKGIAEQILAMEEKRKGIVEGILQATREDIKNKRAEFAELDPIQRQRAIQLAGRLKGGEKLEGIDLEEARSLGPLRGMISEQRMKGVDQSGDFARFLKEAGNDAERGAAEKALQVNGGAKVEIFIDEEKLAAEIAKQGLTAVKELKVLAERIAQIERNAKANEADRRVARNAL
jgi:hypothetical protein